MDTKKIHLRIVQNDPIMVKWTPKMKITENKGHVQLHPKTNQKDFSKMTQMR